MSALARLRRAVAPALLVTVAVLHAGCATSRYQAAVVARGELTLRYDDGFEMWAAGQRVSHGLSWRGLEHHVRCVPQAQKHASSAASSGGAAVAFSTLGVIFGAGGLMAIGGLVDEPNRWQWIGAAAGSSVLGLIFALTSRALRNSANGHALDAMNYYNDAVGSLGATCDDLAYPAPAGALPPELTPPPPPPATVVPPPSAPTAPQPLQPQQPY